MLYLFHGNNLLTLHKEIKKWTDAFLEKNPDGANLTVLAKDTYSVSQLLSEASTIPFLGDKRLIICHGITSQLDATELKKLAKKLAELPESTILVFAEENLKKNAAILNHIGKISTIKEFNTNSKSLTTQLQQILSTHNKTIDPYLAEELVNNLEQDPFRVENEAHKLGLYVESNQVTKEDINQIVRYNTHLTVFQLMDHLTEQRLKESLNDIQNLLNSGEELTMIFYMFAKQIRNLIIVKKMSEQHLSASKISVKSGINTFIVNKLSRHTQKFTFTQLTNILEQILKIDTKIKTGGLKYSKSNPHELLFNIEKMLFTLSPTQTK